jgi:hypothetical protein
MQNTAGRISFIPSTRYNKAFCPEKEDRFPEPVR